MFAPTETDPTGSLQGYKDYQQTRFTHIRSILILATGFVNYRDR